MSEQSTPIVQYNKEDTSKDIPSPTTTPSVTRVDPFRVDIMTSNKYELFPVIEHQFLIGGISLSDGVFPSVPSGEAILV